MLNKRDTAQVLDRDFLESRSKILELAAILDRIDRATDHQQHAPADARLNKLTQAIDALAHLGTDRAETIQRLFSLDYDPTWIERMELKPNRALDH